MIHTADVKLMSKIIMDSSQRQCCTMFQNKKFVVKPVKLAREIVKQQTFAELADGWLTCFNDKINRIAFNDQRRLCNSFCYPWWRRIKSNDEPLWWRDNRSEEHT